MLKLISISILLGLLSACAVNPVTGDRNFVLLSESQEIELGQQYHEEILKEYGVYSDKALQSYVDQIGQTLAKVSHREQLAFHFTVLDSPEVNAFALPGGYVYITRGIMAYLGSAAELAGVLGHEIGHVTARHGVQQQSAAMANNVIASVIASQTGIGFAGNLSQLFGGALLSGYGREHELEADRLGAEYLARDGYAAENMIDVIGVLKDQEVFAQQQAGGQATSSYHALFATHPKNDQRLQEVIKAAERYQNKSPRDPERETYLQKIEGMPFNPPGQKPEKNTPWYIALYRVQENDQYADLAARSPLQTQAEAYLRLLNGDYPDGKLIPGRLIKIIAKK